MVIKQKILLEREKKSFFFLEFTGKFHHFCFSIFSLQFFRMSMSKPRIQHKKLLGYEKPIVDTKKYSKSSVFKHILYFKRWEKIVKKRQNFPNLVYFYLIKRVSH
jgi:hypothetical protein